MSSSSNKTDFLRFSAYSIKDLITRKLAQDTKFTDQVYEGSNLAVIIDIISYMYQCLVYQLNNAASESMFKDTQLYENMVRLVKFLDYNPRGCSPSMMYLKMGIKDGEQQLDNLPILSYSYVDTGLTDANGNSIYFSIKEDSYQLEQGVTDTSITLYNGKWKLYSTIFTASGIANETFILTDAVSDSTQQKYIANDFIHVYIYNENSDTYTRWNLDKTGIFITSKRTDDGNDKYFTLYSNGDSTGTTNDNVYAITLNENHQYEIRFGDGNIGNTLNTGDKVYILYLETNGPDGEIDIDKVDASTMEFKRNDDVQKFSENFRTMIYGGDASQMESKMDSLNGNYELSFNTSTSTPITEFEQEESVDDIRGNAPNWFKTGYRLITRSDYEYFIKNSGSIRQTLNIGSIIDVKCMNNTELVSKFYKWLYTMGLSRTTPNGRYYFDNDFFSRTGYSYIDPSDSNNIYLWIKSTMKMTDDIVKQSTKLLNGTLLNYIKIMTTEIQVMNPITVNFDICSAPTDYVKQNYLMGNTEDVFDVDCDSYIEITLDDNQTYFGNNIQQNIYSIITKAFNTNYTRLGQSIDSVDLVNQIYQINGVQRVRTIWMQPDSEYVKAVDGLSFASWSDADVLDEYEDLTVGNSIRHIEDFQYPCFVGETTLLNRIKIVKKQMTTVNSIKF